LTIEIREARGTDGEAIAALISDLGHTMAADGVRDRINSSLTGGPQLVATDDGRVIGLCGLHIMTVIYRPRPVGRITILEVAEEHRGQGVGRALVAEAEHRLRDAGCGMIELTSNERLVDAHEFYLRLGFDQTSKRFARQL
jgi:GNAT superfamily N-acetyltransferase